MGGRSSTRRNRPAFPVNHNLREESVFKIVVIGESGTGKTSIIQRYVNNTFTDEYKATTGADLTSKSIKTDSGNIGQLQLWDIGGNAKFGDMTRIFYKGAVGCLVVFDASRASTFDAVSDWKTDLDDKTRLSYGNPIPCVLIANKCDLPKDAPINDDEKMNFYSREKGFHKWFEISAKDDRNIDKAMQYLIDEILKRPSESFWISDKPIRK